MRVERRLRRLGQRRLCGGVDVVDVPFCVREVVEGFSEERDGLPAVELHYFVCWHG